MRACSILALLLLFLSSCAPAPVRIVTPTAPASTAAPSGTAAPRHAPEVRFGLVGSLNGGNVWALFDSKSYSYNDYAVRSAYWPRLYHLTIPDQKFEPQAASGMPSPVQADGSLYSATVPLRSDLKWTDGSPFTADDVVFTVTTALAFRLGFDWRAFYDPAYLDHAQAVDAHTVKFYFKQPPSVAQWQYGVLQGPIVQKQYWSLRLAEGLSLLPGPAEQSQIDSLNKQVADLQKSVNSLITAGEAATGEQARQLQAQLQNQQGNLDGARNDLAKAQADVDAAMQSARQALYAEDGTGEPTLGTWTPASNAEGLWANSANPSHPFASPNFDRAVYALYADEAAALAALKDGQVNAVLEPNGLSSPAAAQQIPGAKLLSSQDSSARFLVINPANKALSDPALRRALFCSIDRAALARALGAVPLLAFIPDQSSPFDPGTTVSCGAGSDPLSAFDSSRAVVILKAAGYTWAAEPSGAQSGLGLMQPGGQRVPPVALLAPPAQADPTAAAAAQAFQQSARYLGIALSVQPASPADIRFALFNDHAYDMALVGWRLSRYPGYLCDWFGAGNPFGYGDDALGPSCQALASSSDLNNARGAIARILGSLSQDPPFIPLYTGQTYDVTRGIVYPFDRIADGLSGIYGAPELAIPSP